MQLFKERFCTHKPVFYRDRLLLHHNTRMSNEHSTGPGKVCHLEQCGLNSAFANLAHGLTGDDRNCGLNYLEGTKLAKAALISQVK